MPVDVLAYAVELLARLSCQSQDALILLPNRFEFTPLEPAQVDRLVADRELLTVSCDEQHTHVVVLVLGLALARWNHVDIDIEQWTATASGQQFEIAHPGFLTGFTPRHRQHIVLAVRVATQLQPAPQLPVVREQKAAAIFTRNPGRGRDVAGEAVALKTVGMSLDQASRCAQTRLARVVLGVAFHEFKERSARHGHRI